jgi:hypothetical protein
VASTRGVKADAPDAPDGGKGRLFESAYLFERRA